MLDRIVKVLGATIFIYDRLVDKLASLCLSLILSLVVDLLPKGRALCAVIRRILLSKSY